MPKSKKLTASRLRMLFDYDPQTGAFFKKHSGARAGGVNSDGYVMIRVDGVKYYAHRLAWLYVHGKWPKGRVMFKGGERHDVSIANLYDDRG